MSSLRKKDAIYSYVDEHNDEAVDYLRRLVRIDTHVPPGLNYDKLCRVMADRFSQYGCRCEIQEATEPYLKASGAEAMGLKGVRSNLVATYKGTGGGPKLHLSAHIDTAPYDREGWTVDPIEGKVSEDNPYGRSPLDVGGGYVWGRGACDDKSMLVAMTMALETIHELGCKLKGDLILTGNCDEEIGGVAGLGYLIKEGLVKADYGIQLDGDVHKMGLAAQGRVRYKITTHGKSYHGQMPILGVNAIEKMSNINVALTRHWREELLHRQREIPGIVLPEPIVEAGYDKLTAMLNIGTIRGGVQGATVPDLCEEEVLRCMLPGESEEDVTSEIKRVIESVKQTDPDMKYSLEIINSREGYMQNPEHPFIQRSREIMSMCLGVVPEFSGNLGSTDMNYQVNDGGQVCFTMGTGYPYTRYHQKDESVSVDDVLMNAKMLALIILDTLG